MAVSECKQAADSRSYYGNSIHTKVTAVIGLFCSLCVFTNSVYIHTGTDTYCKRDDTTYYCNSIIPGNIPDGVTIVIVDGYLGGEISNGMFVGLNWETVEMVSLTTTLTTSILSFAFKNLHNLKCLGLHGYHLFIGNDSFAGIGVLNSLDLSGCYRITMTDLLGALNGSERIKQISTLNISQLSVVTESIKFNNMFMEILGPKQLIALNISFTTISEWNLTAFTEILCDKLTDIIMVDAHVSNVQYFTGTCPSLRRVVMDQASIDQVVPGYFPSNVIDPINLLNLSCFNLLSNIDISINTVVRHVLPPIYNLTLQSLTNVTINTKRLSFSNNKIRYLDLRLVNISSAIEYLDLSSNGLSYLQPTFLSERVKTLILSHNNLYKMAENNSTDFGILFKFSRFLEYINFSGNKLVVVPTSMFQFNKYLKSVDLSHNYFEQIDSWFVGNPFLVFINLSDNSISLLSSKSRTVLEEQARDKKLFHVDLRRNHLLCNKCESKSFISWLIENSRFLKTEGECLGENNSIEPINESTVSHIESICNRTLHLALITSVSIVCFVTLTLVAISCFMYKNKEKKKTRLQKTLETFREERHKFKFPVFLAFAGEDEDFVEQFIMEPLKQSLNNIVNTEIELICSGDRHFKPGHSIAEQMEECCKQSGVVMLVVSKAFCDSNHCGYETRIAYTMQKPFILLFKEYVPEAKMTPLLRIIFRQYVRVLFKQKGNGFSMSTTWGNVSDSIFQLIAE